MTDLQPATRVGEISEVIRPAAIVPEDAARRVLVELALRDVQNGGVWEATPSVWGRYDRPWNGPDNDAGAELIGRIHVAYGTPTKYEITVYRVSVTLFGSQLGWSVESLCDEALGHGGLRLADCPRAVLAAPPAPYRH
ncbi:hypothetical protein GTR02_02085 [Kineococcus sp. R8]|uniref:hypothetical protein n=1 Tax=Kineococcus siccus TaxID=2696567 RepID=UPI001413659E|nr:hypothetical protein [Kineococcus siccus]NAZ80606.1 hypothetical protein [Kineococcus siccus]